ncbi:hypothetical protein BaRGS_00022497, partial [Batillaria attramentaria]
MLYLFPLPCGCEPTVTGYFWHVTDFHYDHTYWTDQLSCNPDQPVSEPGEFGDYWCDSPWRLITHAIGAMTQIKEDVDFLLWTGDTVAHIKDEHLSVSINMDVLQNITTALTNAFPSKLVYATFGNHDYYPNNQFPASNNVIYNITADMWKDWIGDEQQMNNFRKGGYYTAVTQHGLRVVCLNTNLYYMSDKQTPGIEDPSDQLAWFRQVMEQARATQQKVLVTAHIPPGIDTPRIVSWFHEEFRQPVLSVLQDYTDIIVGLHFGHNHADGFKVIYDKQVTPWRFILSTGEIGPPHNPSIRLVTYDRDTGRHLNIQQYRLDLPASNTNDHNTPVGFTSLYSFKDHYGVSDLSAASLESLFNRMDTATEGDRLLQDYYRFTQAGAEQEESARTCSKDCKIRILCGFRHHAMADFDTCRERFTSLAPSFTPCATVVSTMMVMALLAIALVLSSTGSHIRTAPAPSPPHPYSQSSLLAARHNIRYTTINMAGHSPDQTPC